MRKRANAGASVLSESAFIAKLSRAFPTQRCEGRESTQRPRRLITRRARRGWKTNFELLSEIIFERVGGRKDTAFGRRPLIDGGRKMIDSGLDFVAFLGKRKQQMDENAGDDTKLSERRKSSGSKTPNTQARQASSLRVI